MYSHLFPLLSHLSHLPLQQVNHWRSSQRPQSVISNPYRSYLHQFHLSNENCNSSNTLLVYLLGNSLPPRSFLPSSHSRINLPNSNNKIWQPFSSSKRSIHRIFHPKCFPMHDNRHNVDSSKYLHEFQNKKIQIK
jgi:hypothetical protein